MAGHEAAPLPASRKGMQRRDLVTQAREGFLRPTEPAAGSREERDALGGAPFYEVGRATS